jgi:hypothetical protein
MPVPGRPGGLHGSGRRGGLAHDRGSRARQDRDRAGGAGDGGEASARAKAAAPGHDLGHVDRVALVTR